MNSLKSFAHRLRAICASSGFFRFIVILLVLEATWIALTGLYPMAFDEDFHLGIIRLYAQHISPFWSSQPNGADAFGAVMRDPSYLYHYLMSFPYRLVSAFTDNQTVIVLFLRGINIALFATALPLYRRLLLKTGASRAIVDVCLLLFVLLPVVPLLAAQINYDNLALPVVAWAFLLTLRMKERLVTRELPLKQIALLVIVFLLASLIKYALLPLFVAMAAYLAWYVWQFYRRSDVFRQHLAAALRDISPRMRWLLAVVLVLSAGLFFERYGINIVRYHSPIPKCEQVLTVQQCSAYGPWIRDYNFSLNKETLNTSNSPVVYVGNWFYGMWYRTFFAVDGPTTQFQTRPPLPVPAITAAVVGVSAFVASVFSFRRLLRTYDKSVLGLFALTVVLYVGSLVLEEYKAYMHTGQPVAINGRYLLPVALMIMVFGAMALREVLKKHGRVSAAVVVAIVLCMAWGGGALTYILRSNDAWYWHNNTVRGANHAVQHTLGPVTPDYYSPTDFL